MEILITVKGAQGEGKSVMACAIRNWLTYIGFTDVTIADDNDELGRQVPIGKFKDTHIVLKTKQEN